MWLNELLSWEDVYCVGGHVFDYFSVTANRDIHGQIPKGTVLKRVRVDYLNGTISFTDLKITLKLLVGLSSV